MLTQNPLSLSVVLGEPASISCKSSESLVYNDGRIYQQWFHKKPGQPPRLLFYLISDREPGISDRYSASGSETDFTLKISRREPEDVGVYYCSQITKYPHTVIQTRTQTSLPSLGSDAHTCYSLMSSQQVL